MNLKELNDPLAEIDRQRERAESEGLALPECMTLATVDERGRPRARVVLLKAREGRELHFFTNYESAKGRELAAQPFAALCIHYPSLEFQARIEGSVERLSPEQSDTYFASRPRASQLGAWASRQSETLESRETLESAYAAVEARFEGGDVTRPPHWGGFLVRADSVELWYGAGGRLHDRARYQHRDGSWSAQLLFP